MPLDATRSSQRAVAALRLAIGRIRGARVREDRVRDTVRALADDYFRTRRPLLLSLLGDESLFESLDADTQALLRLAQAPAPTKSHYADVLSSLKKGWDDLEVTVAAARSMPKSRPALASTQQKILELLKPVCPPAAASYEQALADLGTSRLSWRGTASELREALRELLDKLAPDEEVTKSQGFRLEPNANGPTMKQKTRFILKAREKSSDARKSVEEAVDVVEEQVGAFVRSVYTRASVSVHVQKDRPEVVSILRMVETVMCELLNID